MGLKQLKISESDKLALKKGLSKKPLEHITPAPLILQEATIFVNDERLYYAYGQIYGEPLEEEEEDEEDGFESLIDKRIYTLSNFLTQANFLELIQDKAGNPFTSLFNKKSQTPDIAWHEGVNYCLMPFFIMQIPCEISAKGLAYDEQGNSKEVAFLLTLQPTSEKTFLLKINNKQNLEIFIWN